VADMDLAADSTPVSDQKAAFIAVLGAPNVGKSTLINQAVGTKVSIVSPKVQTTRTRIIGILMRGAAQLLFIDTPGIFEPRRRLDRAMVAAAWSGAEDGDRILMLVDATRGIDGNTRHILDNLKARGLRAWLAINKTDAVKKPALLELTQQLSEEDLFDEVFMISARSGDGVGELLDRLADAAAPGPWLYPPDQISDMPERQLAAEITREQLYLQLRQELPYAATVETETWEERPDGSVSIEQVIFVERDTQRAIILGKGGQRIRSLGTAARTELGRLLGCTVHLKLFVKVREKWGDDPERYSGWGLDFNA